MPIPEIPLDNLTEKTILETKIAELEKELHQLREVSRRELPEDIAEWPGLWRVMCERMFTYCIQMYNCSRTEAAKNAQHICRKLYEDKG